MMRVIIITTGILDYTFCDVFHLYFVILINNYWFTHFDLAFSLRFCSKINQMENRVADEKEMCTYWFHSSMILKLRESVSVNVELNPWAQLDPIQGQYNYPVIYRG